MKTLNQAVTKLAAAWNAATRLKTELESERERLLSKSAPTTEQEKADLFENLYGWNEPIRFDLPQRMSDAGFDAAAVGGPLFITPKQIFETFVPKKFAYAKARWIEYEEKRQIESLRILQARIAELENDVNEKEVYIKELKRIISASDKPKALKPMEEKCPF